MSLQEIQGELWMEIMARLIIFVLVFEAWKKVHVWLEIQLLLSFSQVWCGSIYLLHMFDWILMHYVVQISILAF